MAPRLTGYLLLFVFLAGAKAQDRPPFKDDDDDRQAERLNWFYSQRMYPNGSIPAGARRNAILEIERIDAAARARRQAARRQVQGNIPFSLTTDAANWSLIGPKPTDPGSPFTTSGRISAVAVDPRDNNVVYAGAADGGVWKTTDGGVNWIPLTDNQVSLATGSIALDAQNPDTVYVGTGEGNFNGDGYYGVGILKSTDGGQTWNNIVGPFLRDYIGTIAVSPTNSQVLVCGSDGPIVSGTRQAGGIWRSADGGNTWTAVLTGNAVSGTAVVFDPTDGSSVYAALGYYRGGVRNGVYHSSDAGLTWQPLNGTGAASLPTSTAGRIELAIAPSSPATIYAQIAGTIVSGTNSAPLLGIYKTTDAGTTWTKLNTTTLAGTWGAQMWYYNTLRVSPTDPNVVWSAGIAVLRSLNGGTSWSALSLTGPDGNDMHVDFHGLAFTPDGSKLYIGNDGGMYSTSDITAARPNWTALNDTLAITQFYPGMSMDPGTSGVSLAGAQDNGVQLFDGSGTWTGVASCDGGYTAMDPSFPTLSYASCQGISIARSLGRDASSILVPVYYGIDATDATQFIAPWVIDPANAQTLYFGTFRVWQTRDGGGQWAALSPDLTGGNKGTLTALAVAPADSNTVYVGTSNAKVQMTSEALKGPGASWNDRTPGLPARAVTAIAVDPVDAATAYVTFSGFPSLSDLQGHIYKTTNSGATWQDISGNLPAIPVNNIIVDPDLPNTLYIATDAGVMITTDGGNGWSSLGSGLPKVAVLSLAMSRHARVLRAASHGRSVWEIAIPINGPSLQPSIDTLTPATVDVASGNFVLNVAGSNLLPGTVIRWNGQNRKTTFVDNGHVTAEITADDVAASGRASVIAFNASTGGGSSNAKNFNIGGAPKTVTAAFVNAANPSAGNVVAPRSIASLYGTNLAPSVVVAGAPPLPFLLAGTLLTNSAGYAYPLFFVSPRQINVQVPNNGSPVTLNLTVTQGIQSMTLPVKVQQFAPGLFTTNGQGTGQASTVIANTATLVAPAGTTSDSRPAKPGEYLSIYCTGLGATTNPPVLGGPSPSNPLASTTVTPVVTIGGVPATVIFSGLAPGFVGLNQVNVQVPDGVTPGDAVPLVLTQGGVVSNTATIAVAAVQ